jgi:hypothetical protein
VLLRARVLWGWFPQGVWQGFYSRSMEWREMLWCLAAAKHDLCFDRFDRCLVVSLDAPVVLGG